MPIFSQQAEALRFHLSVIAPLHVLRQSEKFFHVDDDTAAMMLDQAARFSEERLYALAASGDQAGCVLENGRVRLPPGTAEAWRQWCELGFPLLSLPQEYEGLDFPAVVQCAVQEIGDAANLAFGMQAINIRCAALALHRSSPALAARWVPEFASGQATSTIVISEAQAGSDVGRISTAARPLTGTDRWLVRGGKLWISYGDHDASRKILHLVLARVPDAPPGTRGLGLFAVPSLLQLPGDEERPNAVRVLRLEHKMGLHASPTCVLDFDDAQGWLIGRPGEGIRNLFEMMNAMRLAVGVQGAAAASAAALHAEAYARERPQGGPPGHPPVPITRHADVRRMLLEMRARAELIRALALRTAWYLDLAAAATDAGEAGEHQALAELLLPLAKTLGAEAGFEVASQGIQVLGGYGYTADYPLERIARDIRVAAIYEGTSGIQALDFLLRKVCRDEGAVLRRLLDLIGDALSRAGSANPFAGPLRKALEEFHQDLPRRLALYARDGRAAPGQAYGFLRYAGQFALAWGGLDLYAGAAGSSAYEKSLRAALALHAHTWPAETARWRAASHLPPELLEHRFEDAGAP